MHWGKSPSFCMVKRIEYIPLEKAKCRKDGKEQRQKRYLGLFAGLQRRQECRDYFIFDKLFNLKYSK